MSTNNSISEKIIADAHALAEEIILRGEQYYNEKVSSAETESAEYIYAQRELAKIEAEKIKEGKATLSRLEMGKIKLATKQGIIGDVYKRAYEKLLAMNEEQALCLAKNLISANAEVGDTVIISANGILTKEKVSGLEVVKKLGLSVSNTGNFSGGIVLSGAKCDKDLTYTALCSLVREETEAEVSSRLFDGER